jgi:hypothetical protein
MMDSVTLLFSGIVTLCTLGSALLTVFLLNETRRMREVQTEPRVDVTYRVREEWIAHLDIVIKNIGLGSAHDVRFQVEPVTESPETIELLRELTEIGFIRVGLSYLSPGQTAASFFTNVSANAHGKLSSKLRIVTSYRGDSGKRYSDVYHIDLSELAGLRRVGDPPLHSMAKSLDALHRDVRDLLEIELTPNRQRR